jgi:LmbE family N-acetylglucosaminyl deacetylase
MTDPAAPPTPPNQPHDWRPGRFMVVVAHPDDAEFGPAATAAKWVDAGSVGWLVCCTSGDQGGEDPHADPLALAATREAEQRAAATIVGYAGVSFLHQPDGALANDLPLRELLVREIRTFRPDAVLTQDPEVLVHRGGGINHTDHRAAGMAAVDAVYPAARNPMAFPWLARAGLAPHVVRRIYLFWTREPTAWVDVSATIGRKVDALLAHASQIKEPAHLGERMLEWAAEEGAPIGVAAGEDFRLVILEDDETEGPAGA